MPNTRENKKAAAARKSPVQTRSRSRRTAAAVEGEMAMDQQALINAFTQALTAAMAGMQAPVVAQQPQQQSAFRALPAPKLSSPESLTLSQFRDWKQRWADYAAAQKIVECALETQHGILRSSLDSEWTMLWNSSRLGIAEDEAIDDIVSKLERYLRGKRNPLLDRQEFHRRDQQQGESVDRYYAALKALDDVCAHEDVVLCKKDLCGGSCITKCENAACGEVVNLQKQLQETRIRDRLICGLRDKEMQKRVLTEQYSSVLTLDKVLAICVAVENSDIAGDSLKSGASGSGTVQQLKKSSYKKQKDKAESGSTADECRSCGGKKHDKAACPAMKKPCSYCQKLGHWEKKCFRKEKGLPKIPPQQKTDDNANQDEKKKNNLVTVNSAGSRQKFLEIPCEIAGKAHRIKWEPDTGAEVDVISLEDVQKLGAEVLHSITSDKLEVYAANGTSLGPVGSLAAVLKLNGRVYNTVIRVNRNVSNPLLSRNGCIALGLIDNDWPHSQVQSIQQHVNVIEAGRTEVNDNDVRQKLIDEAPEVFDDSTLRVMQGPAMKIELVEGAVPFKRYKANTIPFHWREKVEAQIDEMLKGGIIEPVPVGEPVDWCHPMVVVPKKGTQEPRMTVDLTGLNKFVRRPAYPTRIPREAVASIPPGMKYFTVFDARQAYWQIELEEESRKLTTFITPWGCFRFRRNVMGLISAGDEHNRRSDEAFVGIDNLLKIVEDTLLFDDDLKTHERRVQEVIMRCKEHGITLNKKKFRFAQPEVDWCGFRITQHGYTPAPHLTAALTKFPVPASRTDVRSFCGLVQQFEVFTSRIAELASPLRALLSKEAVFKWESFHQSAFENLIKELTSTRILAPFHPARPLRLETDAAQSKGLGYALWQQQEDHKWKLIQTGSRFVTPCESRYSATEVELLAVVWAVKKCRLFLLGKPFELVVDHRPLVPILNSKSLDEVENPRIQRMKEKLMQYQPQAVWRAGCKHTVVDVFSRYPVGDPEEDDLVEETDINAAVVQVCRAALHDNEDGTVILEDPVLKSVRELGEKCHEYSRLKQLVVEGFPVEKHQLDVDLHQYWQKRLELLSVENGLLLMGARLVIPSAMRKEVLKILHASHQGQERTLRRARQAVYWPGMTNDVKNVVSSCAQCAQHLPSQTKEPLMRDEEPTRPFECVGVDLFHHAGFEYIAMVDRYSGWLCIGKCGRSSNTGIVIAHLKRWFTDLGIPRKLESDNGPQFASLEFQNFARKWQFVHDTSSPHYPQSNGLAEAAVKAASSLLAKTSPSGDLEKEEFQLGLLELRNTPKSHGMSPAHLLFGEPLRTKLPIHRSSFAEAWRSRTMEEDERAARLRKKADESYNSRAKGLTPLKIGEVVRIQDPTTKEWRLIGTVIELNRRGRSYNVRTESGRVFRRNRRLLRRFQPADEPQEQENPVETEQPRMSTRTRRAPDRWTYVKGLESGSNLEEGHVVSATTPSHHSPSGCGNHAATEKRTAHQNEPSFKNRK